MIEYVFTYVTSRLGPPLGLMLLIFVSGAVIVLPYAMLEDRRCTILSWLWLIISTMFVFLIWAGVAEYYGGSA